MNKMFVFFVGIFFSGFNIKPNNKINKNCGDLKVKLVLLNDNASRPLAVNEKYFWSSKNLSEIIFNDEVYYNLVSYQITQLKKDTIPNNFSVGAAVLLINQNQTDTFYTTTFFNDWRKNSEIDTYTAENHFMEKMFRPLYLGIYNDMNKGIY